MDTDPSAEWNAPPYQIYQSYQSYQYHLSNRQRLNRMDWTHLLTFVQALLAFERAITKMTHSSIHFSAFTLTISAEIRNYPTFLPLILFARDERITNKFEGDSVGQNGGVSVSDVGKRSSVNEDWSPFQCLREIKSFLNTFKETWACWQTVKCERRPESLPISVKEKILLFMRDKEI